jgi:hypothetical protein
MSSSRYLIRHDAIVVPDFHSFIVTPRLGGGLFDILRFAARSVTAKTAFDCIAKQEHLLFIKASIDSLIKEERALHARAGGSVEDEKALTTTSGENCTKISDRDRASLMEELAQSLNDAVAGWDELVTWAEADESGGRPYFSPLENEYNEGIWEFSACRDRLGYAVSGMLRLTDAGVLDGDALVPQLAKLEVIDERYRKVLGDRRDVRALNSTRGEDVWVPAEFWWHYPAK